jgi:hypothetical protein
VRPKSRSRSAAVLPVVRDSGHGTAESSLPFSIRVPPFPGISTPGKASYPPLRGTSRMVAPNPAERVGKDGCAVVAPA